LICCDTSAPCAAVSIFCQSPFAPSTVIEENSFTVGLDKKKADPLYVGTSAALLTASV
jgi:hypothetical protein